MEQIEEIVQNLGLDKQLKLEDIPDLDLYMDQVIQLFEKTYRQSKRDEDEKILTKTMINNYAKGKLLPPIKNKKYSKNHLILMNFVYELKGALSLTDIKMTLSVWNQQIGNESLQLEESFQAYLTVQEKNLDGFFSEINKKEKEVGEVFEQVDTLNAEQLKQSMLILSCIHMSNLYRRTAEKLIDQLAQTSDKEV
ncbi:hypothetical protein AJ85_05465 [Alkalihalobacillus alcalophilus ATCC 27647 = CGMCC 1.3604]|uniref:DUF1836 domain-containing protein n=1 Tax=Alkalihalobacillus alcalophilus ATCC 27647 = CGMCC 1.3604 TaxID=1218173 RepID=A0A094XCP6_ALKAL|nr:DUF1836 domain-containing protein [Alkalihalobacillus alcalophilus]KGA96575.1 hypothetical protein BALCAV_0215460 [Alkalihalobacillus alcalophilus ATCC 27647 = CGMCC 1.3604]MED1563519.1 DUF1836 domain-containing protein [Alkalihalobacillus alcalophilus]THG91362.1 hypothetical protein AJ85_05465 [Alkalihalobacillus alcalophilus ATCC 27647 = CGMCC 1.3604]